MAILFQSRNIARAIFFLLLLSPTALADDFCSLTVRVATRDGYKPSGVLVTMVEGCTSRARTMTTNAGEAKFCDLGITGVTLMIGLNNQCEEVIKGITLNWETERVVDAIYDPEYCRSNDQIHSLGCQILLRFVDGPGVGVPHVQFVPPVGKASVTQSDAYGRIVVGQKPGESLLFTASAPGYSPEKVELRCSTGDSEPERVITLRRDQ